MVGREEERGEMPKGWRLPGQTPAEHVLWEEGQVGCEAGALVSDTDVTIQEELTRYDPEMIMVRLVSTMWDEAQC